MSDTVPLRTRLTEFFGIEQPVLLAPMALVSGGRLAAAVTGAGGLGLLGGGYGDPEWLQREFDNADSARIGCGFITWSLAGNPRALDIALAHQPAAIMLSFGDLRPFADRIHAAGVPLIAQVQNLDQARRAVDAGAEVIVAQGSEAGGHGMSGRTTFTLVPEVVDFVAERSPDTLVAAAGGVVDGRGLAAALALAPTARSWVAGCGRRRRHWCHRVRSGGPSRPVATTPCAPGSMTLCAASIGPPDTTRGRWATRSSPPGTVANPS